MEKRQSGKPGVPPGRGKSYGVPDGKEGGDGGEAAGRKRSAAGARLTEGGTGESLVMDLTRVTNGRAEIAN